MSPTTFPIMCVVSCRLFATRSLSRATRSGIIAIFDGTKKRDIENIMNMTRYTGSIMLRNMNSGIASTSRPRSMSEIIIIFRRSRRSTQAPATGPMMNTGIMVNEISLARATSLPGFCWYTSATSAIWFSLSPKLETIWPNHRKKKLRLVHIAESGHYGEERRLTFSGIFPQMS